MIVPASSAIHNSAHRMNVLLTRSELHSPCLVLVKASGGGDKLELPGGTIMKKWDCCIEMV